MIEDFEAMLGEEPAAPPPKKRGRPTREEAAARLAAQEEAERAEKDKQEGFYASFEGKRLIASAATGRTVIPERDFHMPCSINFLARVLKLDPMTVNRRLRRVEPVGYAGSAANKRALYDFTKTLPYLLKPKMDLQTFLDTLNAADLPPIVNKLTWDGLQSKLRYKVAAQEAWQTEDVLEVLSDVGMTIKDHTNMWVEEMREKAGLSDEQAARFERMVDIYRDELHKKLVDMPKEKQTKAIIHIDAGPQGDDPDWDGDE